jgi:hypothetical protein
LFGGPQGPIKAESPEWRIDLAKTEPSRECGYRFLFQLRNKHSGTLSQFAICDIRTRQIDEVQVVSQTRALILGRGGPHSPEADLVELPTAKTLDHFSCFRPRVSPRHRFLAFIKDFPPRPGPVEITFEYLVYDLGQSATYNRPRFKPGVTYDAGWPVYPPGATNALGENVLPQGSPYHSATSAYLFWLDDNRLAFSDFFQGENRLVTVDVSRGIQRPEVRSLNLAPSEFVDLERCRRSAAPSDFEVWSQEPAGLIHVKEIDPIPRRPGVACLRFVPSPCLRYTELMVKLP